MVKLKKVWKDKWIKALRSGKYQQGADQLRTKLEDGPLHCCLGVLCDVTGLPYRSSDSYPPNKVIDLTFKSGANRRQMCKVMDMPGSKAEDAGVLAYLAYMNDAQDKSFKQLANWIEKNL